MTKHVEPGCDGLPPVLVEMLCLRASHAHPTAVPLPTPDELRVNLEILRRRLMDGWHGGPLEGAGR